jgi:hypothetical protein
MAFSEGVMVYPFPSHYNVLPRELHSYAHYDRRQSGGSQKRSSVCIACFAIYTAVCYSCTSLPMSSALERVARGKFLLFLNVPRKLSKICRLLSAPFTLH